MKESLASKLEFNLVIAHECVLKVAQTHTDEQHGCSQLLNNSIVHVHVIAWVQL